jgi:hypothetical protein
MLSHKYRTLHSEFGSGETVTAAEDKARAGETPAVATIRSNRDIDRWWSFLLDAGFLYEAKLARMGDRGARARASIADMALCAPDLYRIGLVERDGALTATCTAATFSESQAWIMHLASSGDRHALMHTIVDSCNWVIRSSADWVAYTFRDENISVRRLLKNVPGIESMPIEQQAYRFYAFPNTWDSRRDASLKNVSIAPATTDDVDAQLLSVPAGRQCALQAIGRLSLSPRTSALSRRFSESGCTREREAFTLRTKSGAVGLAILDVAPPFWNLSDLSTGLQMFLSHADENLAAAVLAFAGEWFAQRQSQWSALIPQDDRVTTQLLERQGYRPMTTYFRIGFGRELFVPFAVRYSEILARGKRLPRIEGAAV